MPENQEGTGQHKHKSSEEPYPHHEAPSTSGERSQSKQHASGSSESRSGNRSSAGNESSNVNQREYKDKSGETHHHTKTYEQQHRS